MILIDTDHTTYLKYPDSDRGRRLVARLAAVEPSESIGPFDHPAAHQYEHLRKQRLRMGTMDSKIAAIALVRPDAAGI